MANGEEDLLLLQALDPGARLSSYGRGNWFVDDRVEVGGDGLLMSPATNGPTPEVAVRQHLATLQAVEAPRYLVVNAMSPERRHYRWNGAGWQELPRQTGA